MEVSHPHSQEPTPEQAKELERFKSLIERAIADGIITGEEMRILAQELQRSCKDSADQYYRELELYRTLVAQKIQSGELESELR